MAGNDDSTRGQWMRRWRRRRWAAGTNRRRRREGCERIRGCRHSAEGCRERGTHPAAGCSRRGSPPGASPKRSSGHSGQLRYCDDHVSSRWLAAAQPRRRRIRRPSVPQPCPVPSPPPPALPHPLWQTSAADRVQAGVVERGLLTVLLPRWPTTLAPSARRQRGSQAQRLKRTLGRLIPLCSSEAHKHVARCR